MLDEVVLKPDVGAGVVVVVGGPVVDVELVGHSPSQVHFAEHPSPVIVFPSSHSSMPDPGGHGGSNGHSQTYTSTNSRALSLGPKKQALQR